MAVIVTEAHDDFDRDAATGREMPVVPLSPTTAHDTVGTPPLAAPASERLHAPWRSCALRQLIDRSYCIAWHGVCDMCLLLPMQVIHRELTACIGGAVDFSRDLIEQLDGKLCGLIKVTPFVRVDLGVERRSVPAGSSAEAFRQTLPRAEQWVAHEEVKAPGHEGFHHEAFVARLFLNEITSTLDINW